MRAATKPKAVREFGDFQTPAALAQQICRLLEARGVAPASLLEPTCGVGNLLFAGLAQFPHIVKAIGLDIEPLYVQAVQAALRGRLIADKVMVVQDDFFTADWPALLNALPDPVLVLGNPPWITNAQLSIIGGTNLPPKSNFLQLPGWAARTGKSNFDISEWMMIHLLQILAGRQATLALLCKTAVARKVLRYSWQHHIALAGTDLYLIDAAAHFGVAVDACLLLCRLQPRQYDSRCMVYSNLIADVPTQQFGYRDGHLIANLADYDRWQQLHGNDGTRWRSGIKHDCAAVMEFVQEGVGYRNGLGEWVDLEPDHLYPLLKATQLAKGLVQQTKRYMLVPQQTSGADTRLIAVSAPKTWQYLLDHGLLLDQRASVIYRNQPRFAVFGVGNYAFTPWKVAISALHKKLVFHVVGPLAGRPVVLDDTSNFLACTTQEEAVYLAKLLNSEPAQQFLQAFIFWDAKRPITVEVLQHLNLTALKQVVYASV